MSESPENLDPKEATEAKLCAYLEGETTAAERTEIEKYLQSNPQHRKLLSDLAATRSLLRLIPKEPAPPEIAEAFEGQLERSMLLDETKTSVGRQSSRWPQLLFAAAMVALATGLGVVIYFTLPATNTPRYSVATTAKSTDRNNDRDRGTDLVSKVAESAAKTAPNVAIDNKTAAVLNEQAKLEDGIKPPAMATAPTAAATLIPGGGVGNGALGAAGDSLTGNIIKPATEPAIVAAVAPTELSKLSQSQTNGSEVLNYRRELYFGVSAKSPTRYMVLSTDNLANSARDVETSLNSNHVLFETHPPTTQFALDSTVKDKSASGGARSMMQNMVADAPATQQFKINTQFAGRAKEDQDQTVYIARAITGKQADAIASELSNQRMGQSLQSYTVPATQPIAEKVLAATMPTTAPAEVIAKDDRLIITVAELVGAGVDKVNVIKVAEDGSINLPMIETIHAEGLSTADLEKQIAGKYREANLIPNATVQVRHESQVAQTTQPTTQAIIATTQPVDDSGLQVVIVVQKNSAQSTTQPTTQP